MSQEQHFISRVHTKPWETQGGYREVYYFDFRSNDFHKKPSKSVFSGSNLWSTKAEAAFRSRFEKRLENDIKPLLTKATGTTVRMDWKPFRSVVLLQMFNAYRAMAINIGKKDELELFAKQKEPELDEIVKLYAEQNDFFQVPISANRYLFFPESGLMHVPLMLINGPTFGYLLPITPKVALGIVPKGPQKSEVINIFDQPSDWLMDLSIGVQLSQRVLIPPVVYEETDIRELKEKMLLARANNIERARKIILDSPPLRAKIGAAIKNLENRKVLELLSD